MLAQYSGKAPLILVGRHPLVPSHLRIHQDTMLNERLKTVRAHLKVFSMKALVGTFNQVRALAVAFSEYCENLSRQL